jgi:glycosyltransferase involved in cell wall biosynthesis
LKIILDPEIYSIQYYGGISRYYTEVFTILNKLEDINIKLPIFETKNIYLKSSNLLQKKHNNIVNNILQFLGVSIQSKKRKEAENHVRKILQKGAYDLFVPTFFNTYFLPLINDKPFVLTVYDMIHELYPQFYTNDPFNVTNNKLVLLEKATKIIAVSENTKKDILKIYPHIDATKINVIYHGNSIAVNDTVKVSLPEKYILFVGSRDNYKNFKLLVLAIYELLQLNKSLILLCAGSTKFTISEMELINEFGLEHQIIQQPFEENELGQFYKKAICFVFPSSYEGFGIPVLEAMACGCPIVLTKHSSFPEVAGDAGIYFKLDDKEDLKCKINWLLNNEPIRQKYALKGLEQVKKFNWEKAATQILSVYKDAIANNKYF